jgi:hypothetical protein
MDFHKYFTYDEGIGKLLWKPRDSSTIANPRTLGMWNARFSGKVVGSRTMQRSGKRLATMVSLRELTTSKLIVHRIVWEMHYGPIPDGMQIDHINGEPWDNRISNLRLATHSQNSRNARKRVDNTSGLKGASWDARNKKWSANICVDSRPKHLGYFATKEEAHSAYCTAAKEFHGAFARTS